MTNSSTPLLFYCSVNCPLFFHSLRPGLFPINSDARGQNFCRPFDSHQATIGPTSASGLTTRSASRVWLTEYIAMSIDLFTEFFISDLPLTGSNPVGRINDGKPFNAYGDDGLVRHIEIGRNGKSLNAIKLGFFNKKSEEIHGDLSKSAGTQSIEPRLGERVTRLLVWLTNKERWVYGGSGRATYQPRPRAGDRGQAL
ncbi:hypothetical protein N7495_000252 [Penicillium taxi]|uniref:uncharacterized protein n=1 Tax=Penicillium taxi TaxID=168475 RepID=UPI002545AF62|nr:uncharacterized protein N7495_000252 [Penicillium taxi]KAJ5907570.1 hypothetical protein N7495_000252 [Penicillium taxi]